MDVPPVCHVVLEGAPVSDLKERVLDGGAGNFRHCDIGQLVVPQMHCHAAAAWRAKGSSWRPIGSLSGQRHRATADPGDVGDNPVETGREAGKIRPRFDPRFIQI